MNHGLPVVNVQEDMLKNTEKNLTVEFVYGQDWQETVYLTDCCEVGVVLCKNTGESLKTCQALIYAEFLNNTEHAVVMDIPSGGLNDFPSNDFDLERINSLRFHL